MDATLPSYQTYLKLTGKAKDFFDFLEGKFDWCTFLQDPTVDPGVKRGIRLTIIRMLDRKDYNAMLSYYWSAIIGTPNSIMFHAKLKGKGYSTFEDFLDEVRRKFN